MIQKKVQTLTELEDHLIRVVSAYRRSYKFCGNIDKVLKVTTGIVSSSAIIAVVPAIPVFLAALGAFPVVTGVLSNVLRLSERKTNLKIHHRQFKQLLSYVKSIINEDDHQRVISDVFNKIMDMQKKDTYVEPLEMYMKKYKLNGYTDDNINL